MDLTLTKPVQVTLPASVAGTTGPAYVVPAPITPTGSAASGSLSPTCSPPASPTMPPSPSPSLSSSDSSDSLSSSLSSSASSGSSSTGLPSRPVAEFLFHLTRMLTDPSIRNLIEWTPQGSIRVHDPHTLENEVLGKYFRHSKYSSFQRQLNYFGFRKVGSKGRMSPCSYINDDTGDDLSSLLSIKRKTANRARSRKAQAEKEAAAKAASAASVSDSDSCGEEADAEPEKKKVAAGKKEKKEKKDGSKKRKKSSSSPSSSGSGTQDDAASPKKKSKKSKKRSSPGSSGSSSSTSSKQVKIEAKPEEQESKEPAPLAPAAIAVSDIDFGPPGSIDFQALANVSLPSVEPMPSPTISSASPATTAAPAPVTVSPAATVSTVPAPPTPTTSSKGHSSWEHLLLPQASSMPVSSALAQPVTPSQPITFQPVLQVAQAPLPLTQPVQQVAPAAAAPVAAAPRRVSMPLPAPAVPAPTPFVTKFNTPNPLEHLMAAPAPLAPAPATAAVVAQESVQQQQQMATPATSALNKMVNKPSYAVVPALELADEEISVEKLLSLEWTGVGSSTTSSSAQKNCGSFSDLGDYTFPTLSPNSSLVDLAAIPIL